MEITSSRWAKKMLLKKRNDHGIIMGMDAGKHFAKPDPRNFQQKLLAKYEYRVSTLTEYLENSLAQ